jgi:hypothetical protein
MWPSDVHAFEGTRPVANRVNLLPALDPYTTGYTETSRVRFADPELLPFLYDRNGINSTSVILIEGTVGGLWDFTLSDRKIEIRIGLFDDPTPRALEAIEGEAGLVAGYFNARDVTITRVRIRNKISDRGPSAYMKPLAGQEPKTPAKPAARPAVAKSATTRPRPGPKPVPSSRAAPPSKRTAAPAPAKRSRGADGPRE